ncbi:MAG TPA: OmpA family protein [Candidatus Hydrogenedentes bacterium]|nr:OmpA family protein [Candidatus Hydrogenedentota bacterium]HNT87286.1 OmpA family protein [Candidatus Hydrogenedentota bacterium]
MKKVVMLALMAALVAGTAQAAKVWDDMSWWGNTGATPEPYKCDVHPGYWWWPTVPASNADDGELWGNRGIVYSMWTPPAPAAEVVPPPAAPEPAPVRTAILMNNVLFDFDSNVLKAEGKAEINRLVEAMKQYPGDTVVVLGHCCNIGTDAYNMGLGQRRADAVKNYMVQQGIDAGRIQSVSKGESEPLNDNSTPALRASNRRAEFQITVVN